MTVLEGVTLGIAVSVGELAGVFDGPGAIAGAGLARRVAFGSASAPGLAVGVGTGAA